MNEEGPKPPPVHRRKRYERPRLLKGRAVELATLKSPTGTAPTQLQRFRR